MDARKFLLFLVICTISAASSIRNGWEGPNNVRHIRRISLNEYLVPPPLPRFNSAIRIGRLANYRPTETSGYFAQLMSWLNPFSYGSSSPSPPPLQSEAPYPPSSKFVQPPSSPSAPFPTIYNEPPVYDKPPLPSASFNNPTHLFPVKAKSCNPCNKVPWMPIHHGELPHLRDASFASSPQSSSLNGDYLPPTNHEVPHDVHQAASQEVRTPDFSFVPPLPANGQDESLISPLPNPHLYPGAMPPLFKAEDFNYPVETVFNENLGHHGDAPSSVPGDSPFTGNGSFLHIESNFNSGYGQPVHLEPSGQSNLGIVDQELKYTNPGASYGEFKNFGVQNHGAHNDLSSSSTQVSHGHANPTSDQHSFEVSATHQDSLGTTNHQTPFGDSTILDHQPSEVFNSGGFYDVTGSNGPLNDLSGNSSQNLDQNLPSSYGISGLRQVPNNFEHEHNDLFPSSNIAKNSHAPLHTSDGSSVKIEDPVHFEESPLLDFTYKGESRTDSSSIPPTSNAIADFESIETAGTTLAPRDEFFGTRQEFASTESYPSTDNIQIINSLTSLEASKINDSVTQNFNGNLHDPTVSRGKDISYISPSEQAGYLWPSILSTTLKDAQRESFWSTAGKSYDDVAKETLKSAITNLKDTNKTSAGQGVKRNKQVQVIIPYTSQYTPLPFHPLHRNQDRKITYTGEANHDNYVGEESINRIKVASFPDASHNTQTWPTTSVILENVTKKSIGTKVNNSIDVHRLQKNIDNWTIQEYSKGTTASTISPSSANPYLLPSKQIPDEYLTTTEPINHVVNPHDSNVKTFTLAGFSFNDLEYKSSASNQEESRVQITENSKSTVSSTDASTVSTKNDSWEGFLVNVSSNKERVYVVTPQPIVTSSKPNQVEQKKERTVKETERNSKELRKISDTKKTKKKLASDTFESIEKAYQVLPQAVNNLAVASTGPAKFPLWTIMEHEDFASFDNNEQDNENNPESPESPEVPVLYAGHSKVSHARR